MAINLQYAITHVAGGEFPYHILAYDVDGITAEWPQRTEAAAKTFLRRVVPGSVSYARRHHGSAKLSKGESLVTAFATAIEARGETVMEGTIRTVIV